MRDQQALQTYLQRRRPLTSVVSYPDRGPWGDRAYPGNCSGYLLIDLCATYQPRHVLDPMEGSGTSREVCADMGITYTGFDLRTGTDSLTAEIGAGYDLIFWHPPYANMKRYTDDQRDLSHVTTMREFRERLEQGYQHYFPRLSPGGRLAILMGDLRRRGRYLPFTVEVVNLDRPHLESIIVKLQHNVTSNEVRYSGNFVPILHETLTIFRHPAT